MELTYQPFNPNGDTGTVNTPPIINSSSTQQGELECEHQKASRVRGGGAAKDCFLGMIACFVCFECCKGCCDCIAGIICCPCEVCC
ncbi:hypothetical protein AMATHDRAFT_143113 [Amanita thiersii Skay4041]|uniref:Cysteine-rich transmembrane CYSTM domain-containing protein n=1 Tax=Amanita thiersii Skay4041 TaxID=703135 RepID=A0A2A9NU94_9AGAR|nr:hypothetical protein AMATHDRAFT_143113 [Amanita thiersii Skay4041]